MVIRDYPFSEYRARQAANAHGLIQILRSPLHYRWSRENPSPATPAMMLGTATHTAILEPSRFDPRVQPDFNVRTKAGRDWRDRWTAGLPPEATVLTEAQHDQVVGMRDAVMARPDVRAFLSDGEAELTLVWHESDVECKARLDWVCTGHDLIVDLKTCKDASEQAFIRACANFGYPLQAAWYTHAAERCGLGEREFAFLFVESDPPHGVAMYRLDPQSMHLGHLRAMEALDIYAECLHSDTYPGYDAGILDISLPTWAIK